MNFADDQRFGIRKAGGLGITIVLHVLLAGSVIYGLRTTFVSKPKIEEVQVVMPEAPPVVDPTPPPPKPQVKTPQVVTPPIQPVEQAQVPAPPPDPAPAQTASNDAPPSPNTNAESNNATAGITSPAIADLNSCKPAYPQSALMQGQTGTVRVKFIVGTEGNLVSADVVKSSGVKSLDRAAIDGLSKCKFKPAIQNGNPVQSWFVTDYVWSLQD